MPTTNAASILWAKSADGGNEWLPLWTHLRDTHHTATKLWQHWLNPQVKTLLADDLGTSATVAGEVVALLAALHDVGKASPDFYGRDSVTFMTQPLYQRIVEAGYSFSTSFRQRGDSETRHRHEICSAFIYTAGQGFREDLRRDRTAYPEFVDVILAGHHGNPLSEKRRQGWNALPSTYQNDGKWAAAVLTLLEEVRSYTSPSAWQLVDELRSKVRNPRLSMRSQVLLTSIVIMSDWLASTPEFFPLIPFSQVPAIGSTVTVGRYSSSIESWSLHPSFALAAGSLAENLDERFSERFSIPGGTLRPAQRALLDVIESATQPDVFILEAPMGAGKTEAALLGAELLAEKGFSTGFYFGLPSMATSEAIFDRVVPYLTSYVDGVTATLTLNHSKAALSTSYDSYKSSAGKTSDGLMPAGWLSSKHARLTSTFGVGTIDAFLMMSLKMKYAYWRHLAFAGKAIILDEVHSADSYMAVYLARALEWAGYYKSPVILLSATLDEATRDMYVSAYQRGKEIGAAECPTE